MCHKAPDIWLLFAIKRSENVPFSLVLDLVSNRTIISKKGKKTHIVPSSFIFISQIPKLVLTPFGKNKHLLPSFQAKHIVMDPKIVTVLFVVICCLVGLFKGKILNYIPNTNKFKKIFNLLHILTVLLKVNIIYCSGSI